MTARPPEAGSTGPATSAGNGGCAQQQDASTGVLSQGSKYRNYETVFTNSKAGMTGVDREHVKKVVYEMSKDSAHFINEQRKQAQVDLRIHKLLQRAKGLTAQELAAYTRAQDMKLAALEATRDLSRVWIHVDMDAFYAAVEERDDPSLASKPMAVGGVGMITTANYLARKFGVRSAMPGFIARKLCPELVFVRPDFAKYKAASDQTRAIFCEYDPEFEAGSMDEAYLDVTDYCHAHGITGRAVAQEVRIRVHQETRLTCSAGIAPNTMIAKVCSDINKPNGQFEVPADADAVRKFVEPLPIRKVSGIGKVAEQTLKALGVELCSQLIEKRGLLAALFSQISSDFFMAVGLGLGRTLHHEPVKEGEVGRRGMSVERTFRAISSKADLEAKCAELAHKLAEELADGGGLKGKTITLKLKTTKFELRTRAITLPVHVSSAEDILAPALRLLRVELPLELRLMGIRMSNFKEVRTPPGQKSIADFVRKEAVPAQRSEQDADAAPSEQPPAASSHHEADLQLNGGPAADGCPLELSLRDWGTAGEAVHTQGPASQHIELSLEDWQHARDDPLPADAVGDPGAPGNPDGCSIMKPAAAAQQQGADQQAAGQQPSTVAGMSDSRRDQPKTWACQLCTYADNQARWLRCEVCDTMRGTTLDHVTGHSAMTALATEPAASGRILDASSVEYTRRAQQPQSSVAAAQQASSAYQDVDMRQPLGPGKIHSATAVSARSQKGMGSMAKPAGQRSIVGFLGESQGPHETGTADGSCRQGGALWTQGEGEQLGHALCQQCSQWVPDADKAEHEDFHMALDMQSTESAGTSGRAQVGSQPGPCTDGPAAKRRRIVGTAGQGQVQQQAGQLPGKRGRAGNHTLDLFVGRRQ